MLTAFKAGVLYFAIIFGAGTLLGSARVLWLAPRFGTRAAELIEMPVMLAVMVLASQFVVRRLELRPMYAARLGMGLLGLSLLLAAELALVLRLRGLSFGDYVTGLDLVTALPYCTLLGVMGVLPLFALPAVTVRRPTFAAIAAIVLAMPIALTYEAYRRDIGRERVRVSVGSELVHTACGPIEYASRGQGAPIVVVHGSGGGYDQGLDFAEPLATQGFRVIAMSRFGYLRTPLPQDASPAAQADAHACLLDALKIERAAIIGASAGAPSTLQFALRHPQRTTAAILLVPAVYAPRSEAPAASMSFVARFMFEQTVKSDLLFWLLMKASPSTILKTLLATPPQALKSADPGEKKRVELMMRHILPLSARQAGLLNEATVMASLERYELEKISAPTLIISAADDLYGTYASGRYTAAHIPGAEFLGYESGGHVWIGHHDEILAAINRFLRRGPPLAKAAS